MIVLRIKYYILFFLLVMQLNAVFSQSSIVNTPDNYFPGIFSVPLQPVMSEDVAKSTDADLYVYVFLSPECPLCQHYIPELKKLQTANKNKLLIKGIVPGMAYSKDTLVYFKSEYAINFPLFVDPQKELSNYLSATVTPEVMVFTKKGNRIYQGAIDNRMMKLGEKRIKPSVHYLEDAISAALSGKKIAISKTEAKGCLINDF